MTRGRFTPGPWRFDESIGSSCIRDKEGVCLAVAYDLRRDSDGGEEEANGHLIAATPVSIVPFCSPTNRRKIRRFPQARS